MLIVVDASSERGSLDGSASARLPSKLIDECPRQKTPVVVVMRREPIDAHVHLFPSPEIARLAKANHAAPFGTISELLSGLEAAQVGSAVVANFLPVTALRAEREEDRAIWKRQRQQNAWVLGAARTHRCLRVLAGAFVPLDDSALDHLADCLADPRCVGIKLHPSAAGFDLADDEVAEIGALIAAADKALLVHAGIHYPGHPPTTIESLISLIKSSPDCRIVIAHLGGEGSAGALELLRASSTVWLDTSEILTSLPVTAARDLLDRLLGKISAERIVHGSGFPSYGPADAVRRLFAISAPHDAWTMLTRSACDAYGLDRASLPASSAQSLEMLEQLQGPELLTQRRARSAPRTGQRPSTLASTRCVTKTG